MRGLPSSLGRRMTTMKEKREKEEFTPTIGIPIGGPLDSRKNVDLEPRPFTDLPEEVQAMLMSKKTDNKERSTLDILSQRHMLALILYIERMQPVLKCDIYNDISRGAGMAEKINDLHRLGLIEVYQTARYNSNIIVLTDKGRRTAEIIRQMVGIIQAGIGSRKDLGMPGRRRCF